MNKQNILNASLKKIKQAGLSSDVLVFFSSLLKKIIDGDRGFISHLEDIKPLDPSKVVSINSLSEESIVDAGKSSMKHLAVIKLNGGLGTGMGLNKAKSLLKIKDDQCYLDIIVKQILGLRSKYKVKIPLVFLNSFNTRLDTLEYLSKYDDLLTDDFPLDIIQNKFPKIRQDNLMPADHSDDSLNWNPPGHGDLYSVLTNSGLLNKFLGKGYRYAFVSNVDNLQATIDVRLLGYMIINNVPFIIETAKRTEADKKGGHLAQSIIEGSLVLRERANCPEEQLPEFENIDTFSDFSTNNIWFDLRKLKDKISENKGVLPLDLIVNSKCNNPHISEKLATKQDKVKVFQIETAMGSAVKLFKSSSAIRVDTNERFLPTKKIGDLFLLRSNACSLTKDSQIIWSNGCFKPLVLLDSEYKNVKDLDSICPFGYPSLKKLKRLEIRGRIIFGKDVSIEGNVSIINKGTKPVKIKEGKIINNQNLVYD